LIPGWNPDPNPDRVAWRIGQSEADVGVLREVGFGCLACRRCRAGGEEKSCAAYGVGVRG